MKRWRLLFTYFLISAVPLAGAVDIQALANDTQKFRQDGNDIDMVWWIPTEYWQVVLEGHPEVGQDVIDEISEVLDELTVFSILKGRLNRFGGIQGTAREALVEMVTLEIDGATLRPMPDDAISDEASFVFQMMKPAFASMLGQMGQGMEFVVFAGSDESGRRYLDPRQEGRFTLHLDEDRFSFSLPLASFLPPRVDLESGEQFPGTYRFNPYTGAELSVGATPVD